MHDLIKKDFVIESGGSRPIVGDLTYINSNQEKDLIIFCHGYKGFKDWGCWNLMANKFVSSGFHFLKFNFSHNGGTITNPIDFPDLKAFSENNYSIEVNDVSRVIEFIKSDEFSINYKQTHIIGHSRGGGIACLAASKFKEIKNLITLASVSNFGERFPNHNEIEKWKKSGVRYVENMRTKQMLPHLYQFYQNYLENQKELNIETAIKKFDGSFLICHGTMDMAVNFKNSLNLLKWAKNGRLFDLRTNHTFGTKHPYELKDIPIPLNEVIDETIRFLL